MCSVWVRGMSDDSKVLRLSSGRVKSQKYSELDISGHATCKVFIRHSLIQFKKDEEDVDCRKSIALKSKAQSNFLVELF